MYAQVAVPAFSYTCTGRTYTRTAEGANDDIPLGWIRRAGDEHVSKATLSRSGVTLYARTCSVTVAHRADPRDQRPLDMCNGCFELSISPDVQRWQAAERQEPHPPRRGPGIKLSRRTLRELEESDAELRIKVRRHQVEVRPRCPSSVRPRLSCAHCSVCRS